MRYFYWLWRVLTAGLVILLALVTTFVFMPYLDRRMPTFPALMLAYAIVAYGFLPFILRFWHLVMKPDHIPRYVSTRDGWAADPINIAIVAKSRREFIRSMRKAGWYTADPPTLRNLMHEGYAILLDKPYPTAPFSAFYLFGRKFDIGFQIPYGDNKSPRHRHHVRFWQLIEAPQTDTHNHFAYWSTRIKLLFGRKRTIWVGAAVDDVRPIGLRWRNLQLTHAVSGEHTKERDFIIDTLAKQNAIRSIEDIKDGEPFKMRSQNVGTSFVVDGYIKVITI
jgi:hypothetical protein